MKNLIQDLIKFQSTVPVIPKNCVNPFFSQGAKKALYADLPTVIDTCKPTLNKNNLAVIQTLGVENGKNVLTTLLLHTSGESISSMIMLPEIQDSQKLTAAITYLRRSSYLAIVGLVGDDDTDGNDVPGTEPSSSVSSSQPKQPTNDQASDKQKDLVKKLYPQMDVTKLTRQFANELIQEYNNRKAK